MSISFSQSLRSIQTDRGNGARIGLLTASLLLILWLAWLFLARITLYESGQLVALHEDGSFTATFSLEQAERILPGQSALMRADPPSKRSPSTLPAIVTAVKRPANSAQLSVELLPSVSYKQLLSFLEEGGIGQVDIEVEQLSPARLVARATGQ